MRSPLRRQAGMLADRLKNRIQPITPGARLPIALGIAVVVALVLTSISVAVYSLGGFAKFDLSRPGFERERTQIKQADVQKVYDTTSPVTKEAVDAFLKDYDARIKDISSFGNFRDSALEDNDLQLSN